VSRLCCTPACIMHTSFMHHTCIIHTSCFRRHTACRYDPNGNYIRHFIPALKDMPAKCVRLHACLFFPRFLLVCGRYIYAPWEAPLAVQQKVLLMAAAAAACMHLQLLLSALAATCLSCCCFCFLRCRASVACRTHVSHVTRILRNTSRVTCRQAASWVKITPCPLLIT